MRHFVLAGALALTVVGCFRGDRSGGTPTILDGSFRRFREYPAISGDIPGEPTGDAIVRFPDEGERPTVRAVVTADEALTMTDLPCAAGGACEVEFQRTALLRSRPRTAEELEWDYTFYLVLSAVLAPPGSSFEVTVGAPGSHFAFPRQFAFRFEGTTSGIRIKLLHGGEFRESELGTVSREGHHSITVLASPRRGTFDVNIASETPRGSGFSRNRQILIDTVSTAQLAASLAYVGPAPSSAIYKVHLLSMTVNL
jgi:hypothetical protein